MSFSSDVKNETAASIISSAAEYACFYGMLLFCRHFAPDKIVLRTESNVTAEMFIRLAKSTASSGTEVTFSQKNSAELRRISIPSSEDRAAIMTLYGIAEGSDLRRIRDDIVNEENISPFLAGVFLSCGSMTEPMKDYHLEFACPSPRLAYDLAELLNDVSIKARTAERKNDHVVYLKESGSIEDTLTLMGAPNSSIELMNIKILKDIRNKTNRITNCDNANIERTLKASMRQIEDIEYIERHKGLDHLSPELRNTAEVRLDNPEISLKDLGEMLDKPIGRSGVNHRLNKISEIAQMLREENG